MQNINITLQQPSAIYFGDYILDNLVKDVRVVGAQRILLLVASPLMPRMTAVSSELKSIGKTIELMEYNYPGEPTFDLFDILLEKSEWFDPALVIGVGGGSVMDVAKLLAALTGNKQQYRDVIGVGLLKQRTKQLICVPTTAGTGSEVSPIAILLNEAGAAKSGIVSQALLADAAYIDPQLTHGLPPSLTAETGIDALSHCMEAYTNRFAHQAIDTYALRGIELIAQHLVRACRDGADAEARSALALGSMYGGLCLGPVNTHAVHCLSYGLGGKFQVSHGLANAILLPEVLSHTLAADPVRHARIAVAMGVSPQEDDVATALAGIAAIRSLLKECNIPASLTQLGIREADIPALADIAMGVTRLLNNVPGTLTRDEAIAIYKRLL